MFMMDQDTYLALPINTPVNPRIAVTTVSAITNQAGK